MNEKPRKVAFIPCGDAMEKMSDGIYEGDFENVFGSNADKKIEESAIRPVCSENVDNQPGEEKID